VVAILSLVVTLIGSGLPSGAPAPPACGCAAIYEACLSKATRSEPGKAIPPCRDRFLSCSATCATLKECQRECGRFTQAHKRGCKAAYRPAVCDSGDPEKDKACQATQKTRREACLGFEEPSQFACNARCKAQK
jgi:hypothetical protein